MHYALCTIGYTSSLGYTGPTGFGLCLGSVALLESLARIAWVATDPAVAPVVLVVAMFLFHFVKPQE